MLSGSGSTGVPSSVVTSIRPGRSTATWSSASANTVRVCPISAGMSDASSAMPSSSPSTRGVERRAATMTSGSSAEITPIEKAPRTRRSMKWTAASSVTPGPAASSASMRCAITSVSVSDVRTWPAAFSSARSAAWFSMMPLWMMATRPVQSRCGCAFDSSGWPWVAQRVWPMAAAWPWGANGSARPAGPPRSCRRPPGLAKWRRPPPWRRRPVVAAVFELVQHAKQQGDGVVLTGDADDAAHKNPDYLGLTPGFAVRPAPRRLGPLRPAPPPRRWPAPRQAPRP